MTALPGCGRALDGHRLSRRATIPSVESLGTSAGVCAAPVRHEHWVSRKIDGDTVLVPIRGGAADLQFLFVLNATAGWLWSRLDGAAAPQQLAIELSESFEVTPDRAWQDVQALLASLAEAGLIQQGPAGQSAAP